MTPAECVPLVASVEFTADMRAIKVCAAHPPTAMGGREGAGAAPETRASHAAADMCCSKPAPHMSAAEAAPHMSAAEAAAAHVAAAATVASAATAVASTAATPTSQSVGRYGNGSQRDSRGQDDCSLQLETVHGIFPSVMS
jgi:hypothetical protein